MTKYKIIRSVFLLVLLLGTINSYSQNNVKVEKNIQLSACNKKDNITVSTKLINQASVAVKLMVNDTLPVNFHETAFAPPAGYKTVKTELLPDGRPVISFSLTLNALQSVTLNRKGDLSTYPDSDKIKSTVHILPAPGFNDNNPNDNTATFEQQFVRLNYAVTSPAYRSITMGTTATLTVTAKITSGTTYRWQRYDITGWVDIPTATNDNYTTPALTSPSFYYYRCLGTFTNPTCKDTINFTVTTHVPDNITDTVKCYTKPDGSPWGMAPQVYGGNTLHCYTAPVAGDLDGNGVADVAALGAINDAYAQNIYIYFDKNRNSPKIITTSELIYSRNTGGIAIAKLKINGVDKRIIVVAGTSGNLIAYDAMGAANQTPLWTTDKPHNGGDYITIGFADFDNDGNPEVYAGKSIYNAATGKLLVRSPGNYGVSFWESFPIAANVTGDERLEYVAGNQVYGVNIVNKNGDTGNSMTLLKTVPGETDGATIVADINKDGKLDVIVRNRVGQSYTILYAWDVETEKLISKITFNNGVITKNSIPFVGDIDGDGRLEIVVMTSNTLNVFYYNGTATFGKGPSLTVQDVSGSTGITLFDFNQDNVAELVYRDERYLYIMNIENGQIVIKDYFDCGSSTVTEYPLVLDVDNDGSAEIVVIGGVYRAVFGSLRIVKSKVKGLWAPARKVWNQYAYNVVNVNNDLSIPAYQMNPAIRFPGEDKIMGTADDIQPYNAFLQQQTTLSKEGVPLFVTPDYYLFPNWTAEIKPGDIFEVKFCVENKGDANGANPLYVSLYKEERKNGNAVITKSFTDIPKVGETKCYQIDIPAWAAKNVETLILSVNDKGDGKMDALECDSTNAISERDVVFKLFDDRVSVFQNSTGNIINVLDNDKLLGCFTNQVTLTAPLRSIHGTVTIDADNNIKYTPDNGYFGTDVIEYTVIDCNTPPNTGTAKVYITVYKLPGYITDESCVIDPPAVPLDIMEFKKTDFVNQTYALPLVGDINKDGKNEVVVLNYFGTHLKSNEVIIYNNQLEKIRSFTVPEMRVLAAQPMLLAANKNGEPRIIIATGYNSGGADSYRLIGYDSLGVEKWRSTVPFYAGTFTQYSPGLVIGDINGDGSAEILVYDKIYNTEDGTLIATLPAGGRGTHESYYVGAERANTHMAVLADMDNDGILEAVAGNTIYKIDVNAKQASVWKNITGTDVGDGFTSVADIDSDGYLDVIVTRKNGTKIVMYAWSGIKGALIGTVQSPGNAAVAAGSGPSRALVGNFSGNNKYSEIVFTYYQNIVSYEYDNISKAFKQLWLKPTTDKTGSSAPTVFDFNHDGAFEIVYRDESELKLINASTGDNIAGCALACPSSTGNEYPVIADLDNDGHADILVSSTASSAFGASAIKWFKANTSVWAPSRKVWNQHAYNSVNVNDDLTIPYLQINPATAFPGDDGIIGTVDDLYPFNGFLMQQSFINTKGNTVWPAPNVSISGNPVYTYDKVTDKLNVKLNINNSGSVPTQIPFYISFYKDDVIAGNSVFTYTHSDKINAKLTSAIEFEISTFSSKIVGNFLILKINDNGNATDHQAVCESLNVTDTIDFSMFFTLKNDNLYVFACDTIIADIFDNDVFPAGSTRNIKSTKIGSAAIKNDKLEYDARGANCCSLGGQVDTVEYTVCKGACKTAEVVVYILHCPGILLQDSCSNTPEMVINIQYPGTYQWQYSSDNTTGSWNDIACTGVECRNVTPGWYRVKVIYKGAETYTKAKELIELSKIKLPGGVYWYQMSLQ